MPASRNLKVAIVAGGHGKYKAPFKDGDWECWGVNTTWQNYGVANSENQFARWFELHRRSYLQWEHQGEDGQHFAWLRQLSRLPVYVQKVGDWPDMPTVKAYPFERVEALAPDFDYYHACSIDYMLALAIAEGAKEIALYGVEQWHTVEPVSSRACLEFWSGFAVGRGIKVSSAEGSTFKLAHMCFTKQSYAMDPNWLPWEDRDDPDSTMSVHRAMLVCRNALAETKCDT